MSKRIAILSVVFLTALLVPLSARADSTPTPLATVTGTTLTDGATYAIGTEADLARLAVLVNGGEDCAGNYFVLTNDIALTEDHNGTEGGGSEGKWRTIGGGTFNEATTPFVFSVPFSGTFYGQNHTISGMDLQKPVSAGLFGCIGAGGVVMDLTVDGTLTGGDWVGGIAGINCGSIINCTNRAVYTHTAPPENVCIGGIAGVNLGLIQNCVNEGAINGYKAGGGDGNVGGIAGYCFENTQVINCANTAPVRGFDCVGGIVGGCAANGDNEAVIRNCYNTGNITARYYCGGIAGKANHDSVIANCYTTGGISADSSEAVGAVIGIIEIDARAENCYWLSSVYSIGCGFIHPVADVSVFESFTGTDLLSSEIDGTFSLHTALDQYVDWSDASDFLRGWTDDVSTYPRLTGTVILENPKDCYASALGDTARFTALAIGSSMTYQWQVSTNGGSSWSDVSGGSGGNTPAYTTPGVTADMNGYQYRCLFSGGAHSNAATLGLGAAPAITTQPLDQYLANGATGFITLSATGSPAPTYEWFVSMNGIYWFPAAVTTASMNTPPMDPTYDGLYSLKCEVKNAFGSVTSNVIKLYLASAPSITTQPSDKTAAVGKTATFSVTAAGTPLPTYQWQIDRGSGWDDIAGATERTYTTGAVTLANDGYYYRVVVTNAAGHVTSQSAALHVVEEAVIPGTGDAAQPGLWIGAGLAAACLAALVLILWKRRGTRA